MAFSNLSKADAIRYACRLLSYRDRSEKELSDKLKFKGFPDDVIENTISYLREKGFINDESLAVSLRRNAEETRLLGNRGVRMFLQRRGLRAELIRDVIRGNEPDEMARAGKLIDKKLKGIDIADEKAKQKIWRFLVRKGYSFDTISRVLRQLRIKEE